jgi:hypothetical protein
VRGDDLLIGVTDVTVTNPAPGCAAEGPWPLDVTPPPTITDVVQDRICGGETAVITVKGTRFLEGTTATVGGVAAERVDVVDSETLEIEISPSTPPGSQDLVLYVPSGCTAQLAQAIDVELPPDIFFVDPPVLPYGYYSFVATAWIANVSSPVVEVYTIGQDGTRTSLPFTWDEDHPGRVQFSTIPFVMTGSVTIGIRHEDGCGAELEDALRFETAFPLALEGVEPRFAWTYDYTPVAITSPDPTPEGTVGFSDTPRLYVSPTGRSGSSRSRSWSPARRRRRSPA